MIDKICSIFEGKKGRGIRTALFQNTDIDEFLTGLLIKIPAFVSKTEAIYYIKKNKSLELPKCVICGKYIKADTVRTHPNCCFCSHECQKSDRGKEIVNRRIKAAYENNNTNFKVAADKRRNTMRSRFGVDYLFQDIAYREKYGFGVEKSNDEMRKMRMRQWNSLLRKWKSISIMPVFDKTQYKGIYGGEYDFKCLECDTIFSFKIYCGRLPICPNCNRRNKAVSDLEKELGDSIKLPFIKNARNIISPYELDIFIPNKNVAIEFDGLYWHSDECVDKDYHVNKTNLCFDKGIRLIHVFEDEWLYKKQIVKSRINAILGLTPYKIQARKCAVKEIDAKSANRFIEKYHIQGSCQSSIRLGLFYKNRLCAVMTFSKSRFNKKYDWELLRYCTLSNFNVTGGGGKLLSYFRKNYTGSIISYADKRWSDGNLYRQLGFNELKDSAPAYWYVKNKNRYNRVLFQKHKLNCLLERFDENITECENMKLNGYRKIWDCGNKVFVFTSSEHR